MNSKITTIIVLTIAIIYGCGGVKNIESESSIMVQNDELKSELIDSSIFRKSHFVALETNENSIIRKINRICCDENHFFVLDKSLNKIISFDKSGKFLNCIQKTGQGQGEYISLMDFCVDTVRNQILALCDKPYKIIRFSYSGDFIAEKRLGDLYFNIVTDGKNIYCNRSEIGSYPNNSHEIDCFSLDLETKQSFLALRTNIQNSFFSKGNQLNSTLNNYYTRRFDTNIYKLDNDKISIKYCFDFGKHSIPGADLENAIQDNIMNQINEKKLVYSITDVVESAKYLLFNTNVAIYLYNKTSKELIGFKTIANNEIKLNSNSYFPLNNGKMIVTTISSNSLFEINKTAKNNIKFNNKALLNLAQKVKLEDNPLLIVNEF